MHSIHIAEWILSLVTSRDRAASTVGDLMEQAADRGIVWFWSGILRTAASLLWRGVVENNARVARLAFLGLAIYVGIDMLYAFLTGVVFFLAANSIGWKFLLAARLLGSSLLIGRLLARQAPRRELAACLVFAVFIAVYDVSPMLGNNGGVSALLSILSVSATTAWGRRRRQHSITGYNFRAPSTLPSARSKCAQRKSLPGLCAPTRAIRAIRKTQRRPLTEKILSASAYESRVLRRQSLCGRAT